MDGLRQYILSVTGAAILCSIVQRLLGSKGTAASIGKMLTGLFLAFTVISPFTRLDLAELADITTGLEADAADAVAAGEAYTRKALAQSIIAQTQTYILDKAKSLHIDVAVEVTVSEDAIPVPTQVRLKGNVSPYAKQRLQTIIADDLGIPKEDQIWT